MQVSTRSSGSEGVIGDSEKTRFICIYKQGRRALTSILRTLTQSKAMLALLVLAFGMLSHGAWGSPGSHLQDPGPVTRYINALIPEQTPLNIVLDGRY